MSCCLGSQARINTGFHRFTEIGQIFHNKCIFNKKKFRGWNLENALDKCFIRGEWNWPISHLNDTETQERGLEGVKKFPGGACSRTPLTLTSYIFKPPPPPPKKSAAFSKSNCSSFGPSIEIMKRLFKILLLSLFRSHFWTTFWRTWKFSLVFHSGIPCNIPWSVLNLWLTVLVQRNEHTISRQVSWIGKWGKTLSIARKSNEKTLGNVSVSLLSGFFFFTYGHDPSCRCLTT